MEKISFVIPCYHSEKTIGVVVDEIHNTMKDKLNAYRYEIVLVNDGAPDKTWHKIQQIVDQYESIIGICMTKNFGQHAALLAGYHQCSGDIIVSLDDDGQSPVDETFNLINKIHEGYDVVYGRYPDIKQSGFRILGSWINEKMSEILLGKPKNVKGNSFNAMRRIIIEEIIRYENAFPYMEGLVLRTTRNVANVDVHQRERVEGSSGYNLRKLLKLWMNGFTAFSEKPLRMASIIGICCAVAGFSYGIVTIVRKLIDPNIQMGYSSLLAMILFIGGIIMLLLGIIGEYIGRIYISINKSPQFVIREIKVKNNEGKESV